MIKYHIKPIDENIGIRFERRSDGASGYDLMANIGVARRVEQGERWAVPTGIRLAMPAGVEAQVRTRSGLARDHGVIVLNAPGTVDSDYRGEVIVTLINLGQRPYTIVPGERIAQLVFAPVIVPGGSYLDTEAFAPVRVDSVEELGDTDRGASGHGSTGR